MFTSIEAYKNISYKKIEPVLSHTTDKFKSNLEEVLDLLRGLKRWHDFIIPSPLTKW